MRRNEYVKYLYVGFFILILGGSCLLSCHSSRSSNQAQVIRASAQKTSFSALKIFQDSSKYSQKALRATCRKVDNYYYDESRPYLHEKKKIRVNMHFINSKDSTHNFNPNKGVKFAKELIYYANGKLRDNVAMNLPEGNSTPVHPVPFRYVLFDDKNGPVGKAIYFHYVDDPFFVNHGKNSNNYDKALISTLAKDQDSVLNIFYMVHHPDSVRSRKYQSKAAGIALGHSVKLGVNGSAKVNSWTHAGLLNHEIGHVLSLHHAWGNYDGCDDTPPHPNCWNKGAKPCDGVISNNVMDYNSIQMAYSPCQIAKTYNLMMNEKSSKRNLLIPDWCTYTKSKTIFIRDTQVWDRPVDVYGDLIIERNGYLMSNCTINMPENSKILVKSDGHFIMNNCTIKNECNKEWKGIFVEKTLKSDGIVSYIDTFNISNTNFSLSIKD